MPMYEMHLPALEVKQGSNHRLYSFAVEGKKLKLFTTVSRVYRDETYQIQGYQRPQILNHILEIKSFLESENPMIPNALVVAFDNRVRFEPGNPEGDEDVPGRAGHLVIPIDEDLPDNEKPGWLVDGQQRAAALDGAKIDSFPVFVNAFITDSLEEQRAQFILINATKPLPKGLIYELLPATEGHMPTQLQRKIFPTILLERLNFDGDSPLRKMIHTPTSPDGVIKDNSILKVLETSLSDGALYEYYDSEGESDVETMLQLLKAFWKAVNLVFPEAWGLLPRLSRLMHGVGIVSMGYVMEAIVERLGGIPTEEEFTAELVPFREVCRWTSGDWDFGGGMVRGWNELQNTSQDIRLISDYLNKQYQTMAISAGYTT